MGKSKYRNDQGVLITVEQAAMAFNLGIKSIRLRAKECGAELKIGKSIRIDREKLLAYLRTFEA